MSTLSFSILRNHNPLLGSKISDLKYEELKRYFFILEGDD